MESEAIGLSSGGANGTVVYQPGLTADDWLEIERTLSAAPQGIRIVDLLRYLGFVTDGGWVNDCRTRIVKLCTEAGITVFKRKGMGGAALCFAKSDEKAVWVAMKKSGFLETTPWWRERENASTSTQAIGSVKAPNGAKGRVR
jgi:hypothetical protein